MRFRILLVSLLALSLSACGQKPERKLPNKALEYFSKNAGCLNDMGPHIDKLLIGEVTSAELDRTSLCLTESLTLFKRYIKGTYPDGYSPDDIRAFSEFLITDKTITLELVQRAFELKASMIGGSKDKLTRAEVDRFIVLIEQVIDESEGLVPLLKLRISEPTAENLLALADALSLATFRLSRQVGGLEYPAFSIASAQEFAGEIGKLFGWKVRTADANWIFSAKAIFVGGENNLIESRNWAVALQTGGHLGGLMLAYRSQQGIDYELNRQLLDRVFSYLSGFTIQFVQLKHLIHALPPEVELSSVLSRGMVYEGIELAVRHLFGAEQFDAGVFSRIHGLMAPWLAREAYLSSIFWGLNGEGTSVASFIRSARSHQSALGGQERLRVEELILLAERFNPMFTHAGDKQITLVNGLALTRHHLQQLSWIRPLTEHLIRVYGENGSISQAGFDDLMKAFGSFGFRAGKLDITIDKYQEKRFREANLFTPVSNGDGFIDHDEGTYFVSYLISGGGLSERVMGSLASSCEPQGEWFMGYRLYEVNCARRAFFDNYKEHWDHLPGLRDHYSKLDEAKRKKLESDYERGARPKGKSENPISYSDVQGLSTIAHYVESLMLRADFDGNGVINLAEAMTIYPTFRPLLIQGGGLDPNDEAMVEAVFTYMMKYKRPPQKTPAGLIHFLLWKLMKKHWKLNVDRSGLFSIIGTLADIQNGRPTVPGKRGF